MKFKRRDDHYAANVWPAVTDTILLMASIFIVLSVVAMLAMAQQVHRYEQPPGQEGSQMMCRTYEIREDLLFATGAHEFSDENKADAESLILGIVRHIPAELPRMDQYAKEQEWENYYVVLEASGHADIRGNDNLNWELSTQRANTVVQTIFAKLRNDKKLRTDLRVNLGEAQPGSTVIRAAGYSSRLPFRPVFGPNGNRKLQGHPFRAACNLNRRVEIRLFAQPAEVVHNQEAAAE